MSVLILSIVNGDLVAKMQGMFDLGLRFLVDDPIWAADFAPNGMYCHCPDIQGTAY